MLNIRFEVTLPDTYEPDSISEILDGKAKELTNTWKSVMNLFKEKGVAVPSLACRVSGKKAKKAETSEYTEFKEKLIRHYINYFPKANPAPQLKAIKYLFDKGLSAEYLIEKFEKNRSSYAATTWLTVKYWIDKEGVASKEEETIKLSEAEQEAIIRRLKQND